MPVPLVPVKALAAAKGRLHPWLSPLERRLLAIAMFEDVVAALQATPGLQAPLVVSPDREMWRRAEAIGCRVVEEPAAGEGLNAALAVAATRCLAEREAAAGGDGGLLVVAADLPLATAAGLRRVLEAAALAPVVVVPSHDGDGTNVLAWREPPPFAPRFGPGSAARHLAVPGAVRVDDPGLSMDVDTVEDLRVVAGRVDPEAVTGRRLRDLRLPARYAAARPTDQEEPMLQGTVKSFDPDTKVAVVLTDTRVEYQVPPEAFRSSGLLRLTLGQRVKFRVEGEGDSARVTYVNILTLPDPA